MHSKELKDLASKLISFPSVTPHSAGSVEFVENLLTKGGFECFIKEFDLGDGSSGVVTNIYAQSGTKGPNICFLGHLDVVPPGNFQDWKYDPFAGIVVEGVLFGRGAVDMKGPIASALAAFLEFKESNADAKISFLLTSDEEGLARGGVRKMLPWMEERNLKIDFAIVGEPTCQNKVGENVAIGRRGSINFVLIIKGKQGHVAYPESFHNPIDLALKVLTELKNTELDQGNDRFIPSSLNITSFDVGNYTTNVVPAKVEIRFNIRFNDNFDEESILKMVRSLIKIPQENFELKHECGSLPFLSKDSDFITRFAQISEQVTGIKPELITSGATSDARFVAKYCPCLEFGLQYVRAHQVDESASLQDLEQLKQVYLKFLQNVHSPH
jgi:succinyl-diaminopimelate desuccinylase